LRNAGHDPGRVPAGGLDLSYAEGEEGAA